ncbi:hypothetical protein ACFQZ4_30985 [Catellatospora coxensis]
MPADVFKVKVNPSTSGSGESHPAHHRPGQSLHDLRPWSRSFSRGVLHLDHGRRS